MSETAAAVRAHRAAMRRLSAIDRTHLCQRRDGSLVEVNSFDFNLTVACGDNRYVQCVDGSWIRPSFLMVLQERGR